MTFKLHLTEQVPVYPDVSNIKDIKSKIAKYYEDLDYIQKLINTYGISDGLYKHAKDVSSKFKKWIKINGYVKLTDDDNGEYQEKFEENFNKFLELARLQNIKNLTYDFYDEYYDIFSDDVYPVFIHTTIVDSGGCSR
uniref:Uncharacterized protein n=1 Tax=Marseillevirus LCMAC102 TaxID=2506603 RepID=A0A481YVH2_9VIRU|nr:MAG: hypothetical protein LCMAC102_02910 [Marseillevirus LCMAC102]